MRQLAVSDLTRFLGRLPDRLAEYVRPPVAVLLSPNEVVLNVAGQTTRQEVGAIGDVAGAKAWEASLAKLEGLLKSDGRSLGRVTLSASDHWLRPLVMSLPDARLAHDEIEALVGHHYRQRYGQSMAGWVCRWMLQPNGILVAAAWPAELLAGVRRIVGASGGRLIRATPWSLQALSCVSRPADGWLLVGEHAHVTLVRAEQGGWRSWRCLSLVSDTAVATNEVCALLAQTAARANDECRDVTIASMEHGEDWLQTVVAAVRGEGWNATTSTFCSQDRKNLPAIDFAQTSNRTESIRRVRLAGAALVLGLELGGIAWLAQRAATERAYLEDERARLTKRLRPATSATLSKNLIEKVGDARAMTSSLAVPWETLLDALESARGSTVVVDSVVPDRVARTLKISGTAPGFGDLAAFVDRLSDSGPLRNAQIVSESADQSGQGIRFAVAATWDDQP